MNKRILSASLLVVAGLLAGCSEESQPSPRPVNAEVYAQNFHKCMENSKNLQGHVSHIVEACVKAAREISEDY